MEKEKTLTVSKVFAWIFGVVFLLTGVSNIISDLLTAIFFIMASLLILPPAYDLIKNKTKINLSKGLRLLIALVLLFIPVAFDMGDTPNETRNVNNDNNSNEIIKEETEDNNIEQFEEESTPVENTAVEEEVKLLEPTPTPKVENVYQPTLGERNAETAAKNYLNYTSFSKSGLIEQLEFEGYSRKESEYGVSQTNANWNEQAALKAESYLEYTAFSRSSLIGQLEFDGFTSSQSVYGAEAVGY